MEHKILVVEDEVDMQEALVEALSARGYTTHTANNGQEGLDAAKAEHPDLIILDLMMPHMDGHTMLKKLREDPWGKDVKVLILTSMDDTENIGHSYERGIADYLIKTHATLAEIVAKAGEALHTD